MCGVRLNIESSYGGRAPDLKAMIMPWAERLAPPGRSHQACGKERERPRALFSSARTLARKGATCRSR